MKPIEKAGFLAHAKTGGYIKKVDESLDIIRWAVEYVGAPEDAYVGISWGKDSVVMLHLVQRVFPGIKALFFVHPDEEMMDNYAETSRRYLDQFRTNYEIVSMAGDHVPKKIEQARLWEKYPLAFVGLRAEEGAKRRMVLKRYGMIHEYQTGKRKGSWRACPLAWWTWKDIWAYIAVNDLPYLGSYDTQARTKEFSRTNNHLSKFGSSTPDKYGRIAELRETNPDYYNYLVQFFPEKARLGQ